jgi:hypothetical protein
MAQSAANQKRALWRERKFTRDAANAVGPKKLSVL